MDFRLFFLIYGKAVFKEEGVNIEGVHVKRGQWLRSYRNLMKDLEYKEKRGFKQYGIATIKRSIDRLIKNELVSVTETDIGTLFTVLNYEKYQGFQGVEEFNGNAHRNDIGTTSERNRNKKNNDNKENNDNNISATATKVGWYDKFHQCFNRVPTAIQIDSIHHFLDDGVEEDLLMLAFEKAGLKNATFRYAQQILTEWVQKGIKTIEQGKEESRKFNVIKGGKPNGQNGRDSAQTKREGVTGGKVGRLFDTGFTGNLDEYDFF